MSAKVGRFLTENDFEITHFESIAGMVGAMFHKRSRFTVLLSIEGINEVMNFIIAEF